MDMLKRSSTFLAILTTLSLHAFGQDIDSVIVAEGRIVNATTKEPIAAKISYQSLPYGNIIGSLEGSTYSIPMYDASKYSITVEATGFQPAKYMLDPAESNPEKRVIKDIELSPGIPANTHVAGHVMRLNNLIFELGKSKISPESFGELELVLKMMKENAKMVIQLEGHTDYQGDAKVNMKLSRQRVESVKEYLEQKGISGSRIKTKAFGGSQPISRDDTPEAHRLNRRVELRILSNG
jgi:OmpA-OmpF porin, OOP family